MKTLPPRLRPSSHCRSPVSPSGKVGVLHCENGLDKLAFLDKKMPGLCHVRHGLVKERLTRNVNRRELGLRGRPAVKAEY